MSKVKVYTSSTCRYCKAVKAFFDENNVEYEEKNIDRDREALNELIEKGHRGVPVIDIDGEEIVGFDKERLQKALHL
ncbi:MAG: glutaredoxin family protein [Peptoniphilaceae bacterium]|nr:glutaredoxin family protein [Peptoniphilaceae bacterium]MDD7383832.1 glutaredoxin family protein [Peptoniphilaceae bacterium]MDY3737591.1 glutaredoxin family protein [Peptoniphilaceae bacterium]